MPDNARFRGFGHGIMISWKVYKALQRCGAFLLNRPGEPERSGTGRPFGGAQHEPSGSFCMGTIGPGHPGFLLAGVLNNFIRQVVARPETLAESFITVNNGLSAEKHLKNLSSIYAIGVAIPGKKFKIGRASCRERV